MTGEPHVTGERLDADAATPRQRRLIARGEQLLRERWPDIELRAFDLPDDDAVLLVQPARGGVSLYVASDESVLFTASSVEPGAALTLFRSGRRTPVSDFAPGSPGDERPPAEPA